MLACQAPVQCLIGVGAVRGVSSTAAERCGDVPDSLLRKDDGQESLILSLILVEVLIDESRLPGDAEPFSRWYFLRELATIGLGTNQEDKVGLSNLLLHPKRPSIGGYGLVLVEIGIDPITTKPVGEGENGSFVLRTIVTIADEDLWGR